MARLRTGPGISRLRRTFLSVACIYPLMLVCLTFAHLFFPQRNGPLALSQVFAPYLFLPLLLIVPLLFLRGSTVLRVLLLGCLLIFAGRFLPRANVSPASPDPEAAHLSIMSWNTYISNPRLDEALEFLRTKPADVVALLEPKWEWYFDINNNHRLDAVYPYRRGALLKDDQSGVVLMSVYPILEDGVIGVSSPAGDGAPTRSPDPLRSQWARLDLGGGRTVTVVAAHPYPPSPPIKPCPHPSLLCYDTTVRDAQLERIHAFVSPMLVRGDPVILAGDFNVTDREPGYSDIALGLRDAHLEAGSGTGSTWRPDFLMSRELPILRIDYQFSSPSVKPLRSWADCKLRGSDHCIVFGTFELSR